MAAPTTAEELLDLIQRSGVADEAKLRASTQKLKNSGGIPPEPQKFAIALVRDGILTYFQAEQLLQGKYKRFTIGKYKVLEKLGAGGMAQVFLCEHKLMRRRVAIKVLPTAKADDPSSLERFYREARAVAAVDHPNIVRAYDIDQDENLHFLVMEYVDGTNLQDLIKKFGPLDPLRACHYMYASAVGLEHAHEMGLIHRDIKPGNILLDRTGVVKILDMGLARFFHDEEDALTKKYDENVLGTADYLAPEQALDSHAVDIRADIYSLGATFYFLLTGSAPFPEGSVAQKLIWHQNRQPKPIRAIRPEVPEEVVAIVEKMMAKKTEQRYQTPGEVMAALAPWVTTPIPPPAEKEMPQISLAASGGGTRGPTSLASGVAPVAPMTRPSAASMPMVPAVPAPPAAAPAAVATAPTAPADSPMGRADTEQAPVWESLDNESETQTREQSDTDRPNPESPPARSSRRSGTTKSGSKSGMKAKPGSRRGRAAELESEGGSKKLLYIGGGVVLFLGLAAAVYFAFFDKSGTPDGQIQPGATAKKITVSKTPGENTVGTLAEALAKAEPGTTIVVAEAKLSERLLKFTAAKHKDVVIEGVAQDGKPPVISAASGKIDTLVLVESVEGLRFKNLEFDGGERDDAIRVVGFCPGLTFENVTVRGGKIDGIRLSNAAGADGRPIALENVRILTGVGHMGIHLLGAAYNTDVKRVSIRNCRIETPPGGQERVGTGIRFDGTITDVDIVGSRFFNLEHAIFFPKPLPGKSVKASITSNTVYQAQGGLTFDMNGGVPPSVFTLNVTQNYFQKTQDVGKGINGGGAIGGVTGSDNFHGPECTGGQVDLGVKHFPSAPALGLDPNNDATFLRFPNGPFDANGKKIGAP